MRRPGHYGDTGVNPMIAAQMQNMSSQRMQYNSGIDDHQYMPSKAEVQWQWDRGNPKGTNSMSPDVYKEGHRSDASLSAYAGQRPDSKMALEKPIGRDSRSQPHQDDIEVGFEDLKHPLHTFEGLEEKFHEDIMKLSKEQHEAEDKENSRHRERLIDINTQYQEKLSAVRARQATIRDEFLRKESQARHLQYQQSAIGGYHKGAGPREGYGYGSAPAAPQGGPHQAFARANFDSYVERPEFVEDARIREFEARGQYPVERSYGSGGRYY